MRVGSDVGVVMIVVSHWTTNHRTRMNEWIVTAYWISHPNTKPIETLEHRLWWSYVVICQQAGAELQIIIQIKRSSSFKASAERRYRRRFGQLLHASYTPELPMSALG